MGIYRNADSKHWWMYLETAPKGQRKRRTDFLIGTTKTEQKASRADAEHEYFLEMLRLGKVAAGLPVEREPVTFETFAQWYDAHHIEHHKGKERERTILPRLRAALRHARPHRSDLKAAGHCLGHDAAPDWHGDPALRRAAGKEA